MSGSARLFALELGREYAVLIGIQIGYKVGYIL